MVSSDEYLVDTHCHFGGALPCEFVWEAIQAKRALYLAESLNDVQQAMLFQPGEPRTFHRFLQKFSILEHIPWDEQLVRASIKACCDKLIADKIAYTWMRFSINKYLNTMKWHRRDLVRLFKECFDEYAPGRVGLVLSLRYESERANQKQVAKLVEDERVANCLVGIDLVGDEAHFDPEFYKPIFNQWRGCGKRLFAHVGESCTAANVLTAIEQLGVTEICHGIAAADDQKILSCARDHDVCFHIAISSNLKTGVIKSLFDHPLPKLIGAGVQVALGTDDPVICSTTLVEEYILAEDIMISNGCDTDALERVMGNLEATAERRIL